MKDQKLITWLKNETEDYYLEPVPNKTGTFKTKEKFNRNELRIGQIITTKDRNKLPKGVTIIGHEDAWKIIKISGTQLSLWNWKEPH